MNRETGGTIVIHEGRLQESLFSCLSILLYLWELYTYEKSQSKIRSWWIRERGNPNFFSFSRCTKVFLNLVNSKASQILAQ